LKLSGFRGDNLQASNASSGVEIDLSPFTINTHVRVALRLAVSLADGGPVSAANLLNSALYVSRSASSQAFSKLASFFPEERIIGPDLKVSPLVDTGLGKVRVNEFLFASFEAARPFLNRDSQIWGRDYITLGLLAEGDPSLYDEIAARANRNLADLRDEWFRFLTNNKEYGHHRPWAEWWKAGGFEPPADADSSEAGNGTGTADASASQHVSEPVDSRPPQSGSFSTIQSNDASSESGPSSATSATVPVSPSAASPPPPARLPDVWMLSDRPLESNFAEQDRFQFKDYADALATVIDHDKTETPFTMAINAPWGAGKTTLANMIAKQLEDRSTLRLGTSHIICWFNAWMNDDAPNLATAFVSEVARAANRNRPLFRRLVNPLPSALLTPAGRKWRRILVAAIILTLTLWVSAWLGSRLEQIDQYKRQSPQTKTEVKVKDAAGKETTTTTEMFSPYQPLPTGATDGDRLVEKFQARIAILGAFFAALAGLLGILVKVFPTTALEGFVTAPEKAAETGAIQAAARQLEDLIGQATWRGNRFIVFVDDIERCTPPRSVDILDAVNQLMSHDGVVIVFLGDMSAVAASAQLKYKDLADIFVPSAGIAVTGPDRGKEAFGRLYLQKIIQFQFDLPIPPMRRIQRYMKQLAATPAAERNLNG
jgi:KAP family P-loop domain